MLGDLLSRPPNVPLLRALWSLLDGIWGVLKGSWGVLVRGQLWEVLRLGGLVGILSGLTKSSEHPSSWWVDPPCSYGYHEGLLKVY